MMAVKFDIAGVSYDKLSERARLVTLSWMGQSRTSNFSAILALVVPITWRQLLS